MGSSLSSSQGRTTAIMAVPKNVVMADHFSGMQKLPDPVAGCPNFRRVPGYKIYCCGQPSLKAYTDILEKVCGKIWPKDGKIIWISARQEPSVYINGEPFCARPANKIGEFAELGNVSRKDVKEGEAQLMKDCKEKTKDGKLKTFDIHKKESEVEVKELKSLSEVVAGLKEGFPGLVHITLPMCNSASPNEADFDTITSALVGTAINTPVIISDQIGLSRATTAFVIACLFREFQITASFDGLVHTVPGVNHAVLEMDRYEFSKKKDPLFRGEFNVIKRLVDKLPSADKGKKICDKIIDKNGPKKSGGTGIKQLRENIAESKLSYEIMDDSAQLFLKAKIMDNIHKYFSLIVFTAYMLEQFEAAKNLCTEEAKKENTLKSGMCAIPAKDLKVTKKFIDFMEDHKELRDDIEKGKGDLQWERDIPESSLNKLKELAAEDFKGNLGKIVHDLYHTAHVMFSDMPQGDHKKRAKYRFASKTLMRLLPADLKKEVEKLIDKQQISLDLYDVLGFCTWGKDKVKELAKIPDPVPEAPKKEGEEPKKEGDAPKEEAPKEEAPKEEVKA